MTRYRQGYRFELRVKADMESRGWWVIRAAGSHGPADLVCLKAGEPPLLLQCKANSVSHKREGIALAALAEKMEAEALLALRLGRKLVYRPADAEKMLSPQQVESGEAKAVRR
jgi:Holliday junction resolvase